MAQGLPSWGRRACGQGEPCISCSWFSRRFQGCLSYAWHSRPPLPRLPEPCPPKQKPQVGRPVMRSLECRVTWGLGKRFGGGRKWF